MTHDGGSLKSFFEGGAMPQKCIYLSLHCISFAYCPPVYITTFLPKAGAFVYWARAKNGRHVNAFGMSSIYVWDGMGYVAGETKKTEGGEGGGLELVWHIWSKGPVLLLSALLFMLKCTREIEEMTSLNVMH